MSTLLAALTAAAFAAEAEAVVHDSAGLEVGAVRVRDTPSGRAVMTIRLYDLPRGPHAVHLHETGTCTAPAFTSAGDHLADGAAHGVDDPAGPHPGDLPNVFVRRDGTARLQYFLPDLEVDALLDADGTAFVVHELPDDYATQPSGDAGARIACGALTPR